MFVPQLRAKVARAEYMPPEAYRRRGGELRAYMQPLFLCTVRLERPLPDFECDTSLFAILISFANRSDVLLNLPVGTCRSLEIKAERGPETM
jgi:hypothetical protein